MAAPTDTSHVDVQPPKPVSQDYRSALKGLDAFPSKEIVNRILGSGNPREMVRGLPAQDFFWLIKTIGEDDCLPVLRLASVEQWRYLLDLEIWRRDRLDLERGVNWLNRLRQADPVRLARWLFGEAQSLAYWYLFKTVEVVVLENEDEIHDLPEGFFTLDGLYYIRALDPDCREAVEGLLTEMAAVDAGRYQALLLGLIGVVPAEMEERMFRLRNVRLGEHGFLPFEEALAVYAPLDPLMLKGGETEGMTTVDVTDAILPLVPATPLDHVGTHNFLTETVSRIPDPVFLERIRLEFAGLCNQLFSAEGAPAPDLEILAELGRRAACHLNLALERLCGSDVSSAERLLRKHSLVTLFRVGFGIVLKIKWEAEKWAKGSWFVRRELSPHFWGEAWGGVLSGLMQRRPRRYSGLGGKQPYQDFEWLSELAEGIRVLRRLMVLDGLLDRLTARYGIDDHDLRSAELTFFPLLLTFWARHVLGLEPSFSGISLDQAKTFLVKLRGRRVRPPYEMPGGEAVFSDHFLSYASAQDAETSAVLKETLAMVWRMFAEEFERVPLGNLDQKYSAFIRIVPPVASTAGGRR